MAFLSLYLALKYVSLNYVNARDKARRRRTWLFIQGFFLGNFLTCMVGTMLSTQVLGASHFLSIVLYADRGVLQSGFSFNHIPVCQSKTVLQDALSL